jgi:hypothetical protein
MSLTCMDDGTHVVPIQSWLHKTLTSGYHGEKAESSILDDASMQLQESFMGNQNRFALLETSHFDTRLTFSASS